MNSILFSVLVDHQEVIAVDFQVILEVDLIQVIAVDMEILIKVIEEVDSIIIIIEKVMVDHHKMYVRPKNPVF
jgi:hypothetical protein